MKIICSYCNQVIRADEEYVRRELGLVTVSNKSGRTYLQPVAQDILHTRCEVERTADPQGINHDAFVERFGRTCMNCYEEIEEISEPEEFVVAPTQGYMTR